MLALKKIGIPFAIGFRVCGLGSRDEGSASQAQGFPSRATWSNDRDCP